jgi:hypothetical protein
LGLEAARKIRMVPGPLSMNSILVALLGDDKSLSLANVVDATPKEVRQTIKEEARSESLDITPLTFACVRSLEHLEPDTDWESPYAAATGFDSGATDSLSSFALRMYFEQLVQKYSSST